MGRVVPPQMQLSLPETWAIHLALGLVYGLIISAVVSRLRQERAIIAGAITGLVLYVINWAVVSGLWPLWQSQSGRFSVLFTHLVFGLVAAGAYRGLRRPEVPVQALPPPPEAP